jgi:hypothetical protein
MGQRGEAVGPLVVGAAEYHLFLMDGYAVSALSSVRKFLIFARGRSTDSGAL